MASSILNSDDGVISGTAGLKSVGGDDGNLVFQSKGTETARINTDKQIVAAAGTASLPALTTTGDVNTGIFFPAADTIAFAEGGAEAMRIDSSGNVGIGTSSPSNLLDIAKSSGQLTVNASTSLSGIQSCRYSAGANSRSMQIGVIKHNGITNNCAFIYLQEEDGGDSFFWTDNSGNFRISSDFNNIGTTNGTVVGTQTSDERLKDILGPVGYGLNEILAIEPIAFTMKDDPSIQKVGFSAQQVQTIVPEAVYDTRECIDGYTKDEKTGETTPNSDRMKLVMEYTQLIPVLVNAVKELSAKNDALEARLSALEQA